MSQEDTRLTVTDKEQERLLNQANVTGEPVKIVYDNVRLTFCYDSSKIVRSVEIVR